MFVLSVYFGGRGSTGIEVSESLLRALAKHELTLPPGFELEAASRRFLEGGGMFWAWSHGATITLTAGRPYVCKQHFRHAIRIPLVRLNEVVAVSLVYMT